MSGYGQLGYSTKPAVITSSNRLRGQRRREEKMKLTWRQRLRNWLNKDIDQPEECVVQDIEPAALQSDGMRFQLYRASGGYVVETRHYDSKTDRNFNKMYVITEDKDLGEEIGKIITMESLR